MTRRGKPGGTTPEKAPSARTAFHRAWESRQRRGIPTFPPFRRRVCTKNEKKLDCRRPLHRCASRPSRQRECKKTKKSLTAAAPFIDAPAGLTKRQRASRSSLEKWEMYSASG